MKKLICFLCFGLLLISSATSIAAMRNDPPAPKSYLAPLPPKATFSSPARPPVTYDPPIPRQAPPMRSAPNPSRPYQAPNYLYEPGPVPSR